MVRLALRDQRREDSNMLTGSCIKNRENIDARALDKKAACEKVALLMRGSDIIAPIHLDGKKLCFANPAITTLTLANSGAF